jgi:hypothetical protein
MPYLKKSDARKAYHRRMEDPEYRKKRALWMKKCRERNPGAHAESQKKWQQANKDKIKAAKQEWKKLPWVRTRLTISARLRKANKGRERDVGYVGIKALITCEELRLLWERDKGWELKKPSIDRIDPDGDYTKENCRYIELSENRLRNRRWPTKV